MRILFTFIGGQGHFLPLVPVARACQQAGHTVAVAGSGKLVDVVTDAGFTVFGTSEPHPPGADPHAGVRDATPLAPVDRDEDEQEFATNFAGKGARRHAPAVLEIINDWQPDVVVRDEADFGSAVAAERSEVPCATVLVLAAGSLMRPDLVAPQLHALRADQGLAPDPALRKTTEGDLVISPFPARFRHPDRPLPEGSVAFRPGSPAPVGPRSGPPLVYFTLGTVFNAASGDLFERTLAGLAQVPARVVVTVGRKLDPESFGPQPDHVRIERFIPQETLLPTCDLVISHAGSGSMMGALAHGLPSVLFPIGADQSHNAERAVALGTSVELNAARVTPDEVAAAVTAALADETLRANAERFRVEINELPGPEDVVRRLERLVR